MRISSNDSAGVAPAGASCGVGISRQQIENRGMAWVVGAFLICPCHLPLTLWFAAALLGGTGLGAVLRDHPVVAGTVITLAWVAATWRGVHLMRSARAFAVRAQRSRPAATESGDPIGRLHG